MNALTFEELIKPDPRTLSFGPLGLGGQLPPEVALEHQQAVVTRFALTEAVPDHTRRAFERLQVMHTYGLLYYDLFSIAHAQSMLVLDLALAERFLSMYDGEAPFVVEDGPQKGDAKPLIYDDWDDIHNALRRGGSHARGVRLKPSSGAAPFRFTGLFTSLLTWARTEGLLIGQRNRQLDRVLKDFRNHAAHPRFTSTCMPVDSARSIHDVAEIINQLWGQPTPGGRLYPAPLQREVMILGWEEGDQPCRTSLRLIGLDYAEFTESRFIAVRAVPNDDLFSYSATHECTAYPVELLWGPGDESDLRAWARSAPSATDFVTYLDRIFLVRTTKDSGAYAPLRPSVAAGQSGEDRDGSWYAVRADYPSDALGHVRRFVLPPGNYSDIEVPCERVGRCPNCPVEVVAAGLLDSTLSTLRALGIAIDPEQPVAVNLPSPFGPQ